MNIDEMEAGHELDVLVAERVMGWRLSPDKFDWCDDSYKRIASATGWTVGGNDDVLRWSPSTKIADAWEAVDHLLSTDRFSCFDLQYDHADSPVVPKTLPWYAIFIPFNEEADWCSGQAETVSLAICRAALRATEGEK